MSEERLWLEDGNEADAPDIIASYIPGGRRYVLRSPYPGNTFDIVDADARGGLGSRVWGSSMALAVWLMRPENRAWVSGKHGIVLL